MILCCVLLLLFLFNFTVVISKNQKLLAGNVIVEVNLFRLGMSVFFYFMNNMHFCFTSYSSQFVAEYLKNG